MGADFYVVVEHLRGQVADITYIMLAAAKAASGDRVSAILLGSDAKGLAADLLADEVLYVDDPVLREFTPDAYEAVLGEIIKEKQPRCVLFGNTSMGADIAGALSVRLGLPLVSAVQQLTADCRFVCQVCGGKIMAEGELPSPTALITVTPGGYKPEEGKAGSPPPVVETKAPKTETPRFTLAEYIEPDSSDVDISKEQLLIAVGRGIQNKDNISLAEDLAKAVGGTVCGSRPVVDQGWLATSRLVGKSGKHVKPKIYLALGISGAPEHAEAIMDSDVIIALNTDPAAPIFDLAKYGAEADIFDVLPPLTAKIEEAKK
jgi:electron transfer flavoprotein alpha subunit